MASKVYYMDARSINAEESLVAKMLTVFEAAGFDSLIKPRDIVAIKLHCGEWNNTAYLRPVYGRALADRVKALGGRPFVCDTTTMVYNPYVSRSNALDILTTAERNGYNSGTMGCPFICADGFFGTDDYRQELPEGYILKEAFIAKAIASADVLITLSHFKGHPNGVVGGAIKNLGIGAQSKRGKFNVHMGGHPRYSLADSSTYNPEAFKGKAVDKEWHVLEEICPYDLIHVHEKSVEWERDKCNDCRACEAAMGSRGIIVQSVEKQKALDAAIADACYATMKSVGKENVCFVNLAIDITPKCDCVNYSDSPLVPNLGVFASYDPVAIDKACLDKTVEAEGIQGSIADEKHVLASGTHKLEACSPTLAGMTEDLQVNAGEIIGMGTRNYELIKVPDKAAGSFYFPPDPRPVGLRYKDKFARMVVPYDSYYEGRNFLREDKVDLEKINTYYEKTEKLTRDNGGDGHKRQASKKIGAAVKAKNSRPAKKA
jgi:uncharacterized Fe-S center protein